MFYDSNRTTLETIDDLENSGGELPELFAWSGFSFFAAIKNSFAGRMICGVCERAYGSKPPAEVHDVEINNDEMVLHCPVKNINSRGDTLNLTVVSIRCSSSIEDVISVKLIRFDGVNDTGP